jgi:hypothetical protein
VESWKAKLQSRKFWLSIAVVVLTVLNQTLELGMDNAAIATLAASVGAWVLGETALDRERIAASQQVAFRNLQAEAQAVVGRLQEDLQHAMKIIEDLGGVTGPEDTSSGFEGV